MLLQGLHGRSIGFCRHKAAEVRPHGIEDCLGLLVAVPGDDVGQVADPVNPRHQHAQSGALRQLFDNPSAIQGPALLHANCLERLANLGVSIAGDTGVGDDYVVVGQAVGCEPLGLGQFVLEIGQS